MKLRELILTLQALAEDGYNESVIGLTVKSSKGTFRSDITEVVKVPLSRGYVTRLEITGGIGNDS